MHLHRMEKREIISYILAIGIRGNNFFKCQSWASLVAQCLRIRLPMQETRVRALVREDPTCHRATKPESHNY